MIYLFVLLVAALFLSFLARIYRRCPSNKVLVVYGRLGKSKVVECHHGGGAFVWPLIQDCAFLDLTPRNIHIPLRGALSRQNIRINVPSTFTVALGVTADVMNNAAIRLLDLDHKGIESMATEIIIGQMRLTVASLSIEEINQDRERFLYAIRENIEPELHKIGLTLINVNITDITDEGEYIDSIGKKASSMAVNQAKVDVAEQEKRGDIGKALAERERRITVAAFHAEAVKGENDSKAQIALTNAILTEQEAEALRRGKVAEQIAQAEIQKSRALAQQQLLEAEKIIPQQIEKRKREIEAETEAQSKILIAKGEAEAILLIRQAEAEGIEKLLDAKARGYQKLMEACGNDPKSVSTMLMIEKMEKLVEMQVEAISNIKFDKITVWDGGEGAKNGASATSNFLSQLIKSLPPLHDVTAMAGLELPSYLGQLR